MRMMTIEVNLTINPEKALLTIVNPEKPSVILSLTTVEGLELLASISNTARKVLEDRKTKANEVENVVLYTSSKGFAATLQTHQGEKCTSAHVLSQKQFKELAEMISNYAIEEQIVSKKEEL